MKRRPVAYVLDEAGGFGRERCNMGMVGFDRGPPPAAEDPSPSELGAI